MSQADYVQAGDAVDYTPTVDMPAGTVIVQGDLVGVTKHDIKANTLGSIAVEGVFDVVKNSAAAISAGAKVYWDATATEAVTTATGNKQLGKCVLEAAASAGFVRVKLSQ